MMCLGAQRRDTFSVTHKRHGVLSLNCDITYISGYPTTVCAKWLGRAPSRTRAWYDLRICYLSFLWSVLLALSKSWCACFDHYTSLCSVSCIVSSSKCYAQLPRTWQLWSRRAPLQTDTRSCPCRSWSDLRATELRTGLASPSLLCPFWWSRRT